MLVRLLLIGRVSGQDSGLFTLPIPLTLRWTSAARPAVPVQLAGFLQSIADALSYGNRSKRIKYENCQGTVIYHCNGERLHRGTGS